MTQRLATCVISTEVDAFTREIKHSIHELTCIPATEGGSHYNESNNSV